MEQSEDGGFVDRPWEILQVSCIACGRLHTVKDTLEFSPVCPACAGRRPTGGSEERPA
jgi:hypothetical protein